MSLSTITVDITPENLHVLRENLMAQGNTTILIDKHADGRTIIHYGKEGDMNKDVLDKYTPKSNTKGVPANPLEKSPAKSAYKYDDYYGWEGGGGWSKCNHKDGTIVLVVPRDGRNDLSFHAGKYTGVGEEHLLIDLADNFVPSAAAFNADPVLTNWARSTSRPMLKLKWADGSVPKFRRDQWIGLIRALIDSPYDSVYACCMGGHGRTGTFYVVLGVLLTQLGYEGGIPGNDDPVEWLRDIYCPEVVETMSQVDYIEKITGIRSKAVHAYYYRPAATTATTQKKIGFTQDQTPTKKKEERKPHVSTKGSVPVGTKEVYGFVRDSFVFCAASDEEAGQEWVDWLELKLDETPREAYSLDYSEVEFLVGKTELGRMFPKYNWDKREHVDAMAQDKNIIYYLMDKEGVDFIVIDDGAEFTIYVSEESMMSRVDEPDSVAELDAEFERQLAKEPEGGRLAEDNATASLEELHEALTGERL